MITHGLHVSKGILTETHVERAVRPNLGSWKKTKYAQPVLNDYDDNAVVGLLDDVLSRVSACPAGSVSARRVSDATLSSGYGHSSIPSSVNPENHWKTGVRLQLARRVYAAYVVDYWCFNDDRQTHFRKRQSSSWDTALLSRAEEELL